MSDFTFPLAPASIEDGSINIDLFVQEPTRLSNYISENIQAHLVSQFLFGSTAAKGGAIMYDRIVKPAKGADADPGVIAPGAEFPLLGTGEGEPVVDPVVKTGGKYEITREAQKRNDPILLQRGAQRVANTMAKDIDSRAFTVLKRTLEAMPESLTFDSKGWKAAGNVAASAYTISRDKARRGDAPHVV